MTVIAPEDKIAEADSTETALYEGLAGINQDNLGYAEYIAGDTTDASNITREGLYDQTLANIGDYNDRFANYSYDGQLNADTQNQLMQMLQNQFGNINNYANEGVGGLLNQYANSGVLNSSATGKAMGDMGRNVQNLQNDAQNNYMNQYMDAYNKQYDAGFNQLLMEGQNLGNEYGFMDQAYQSAYNNPYDMWNQVMNARYGNQADYISQASNDNSYGEIGSAISSIAMLAMLSDERLKENITPLTEEDGTLCKIDGHQIYDWDWNEKGQELTEQEHGRGVIAQEVQETRPDAIITDDPSGFLMVDYKKLFGDEE